MKFVNKAYENKYISTEAKKNTPIHLELLSKFCKANVTPMPEILAGKFALQQLLFNTV